jgi:single-strand DNA-binding protein
VVLYKRLAEMAAHHLKKGALIYLEGHLQTRKWVGKDSIERHTTEIVGDELRVLQRANENKLQLTVHDDPPVENIFRQEIGSRPPVADTHTNGTPAA